MFSCHASIDNNHFSIPHIPRVFFDGTNSAKREYLMSFVGSYETHAVRKKISEINYKNSVLFLDTGGWHFYNRDAKREQFYIDTLSKTLFSLCPRGTGHGTIRLFEAIKSNCIPVIISDGYKLPYGLI